ncbi:MAG: TIGR03621 family F420-dependent LLM class oxidoreductase [Actinomycetota bacterium]
MRTFRFGINDRLVDDVTGWRDIARRTEDAGFDTLLVADHLGDQLLGLAPLVTAAEATSTLRVGTFVLNHDFRHPVVLAREAATVDLLTEGRFELGLGAGHMAHEYESAGMVFDPPGRRVARFAEHVEVVRRLLDHAGEPVSFAGEHFTVTEQRLVPVRRPRLLVGGNGDRVLATAARHADIVGLTGFRVVDGTTDVDASHISRAGLADRIDVVRRAAGERFAELELNVLVQRVQLGTTPRAAAEEMADGHGFLTPEIVLDSPFFLAGTVESIVEELQSLREELGVSYVATHGFNHEAFAPVVARLAAT